MVRLLIILLELVTMLLVDRTVMLHLMPRLLLKGYAWLLEIQLSGMFWSRMT